MQNLSRRAALRATLGAAAVAPLAAIVPTAALAAEPRWWTNDGVFGRGYVARGYDVVAYFTEGRPVEGSAEFEIEHDGALWRFSSAENRDLFLADPEAYAPQYGGYCAWAVAQGYTASVVPEAWDIVDGRLYLNFSLDVQRRWQSDVPGHIAAADEIFPTLVE